jgi:aminopeptidase N
MLALAVAVLTSSCGLFGIHFKVKNPKKAASYPKITRQLTLLGGKSKYRDCFDVKYYKLDVLIDPKRKTVGGSVKLEAVMVNSSDSLQLDLHKNLSLKNIIFNGEATTYSRIDNTVFVKVPSGVSAGQKVGIVVEYEGKPIVARKPPWAGGLVWKKDKEGNDWDGVACESEGANIWWPNKDDVSDEADSVDISLTIPKGKLMAVSNGVLRDSSISETGKTYRWHVSYPINNYNVTFYIGEFKLIRDTYVSTLTKDTLQISYYVLPKSMPVAKDHFQQVKQHLAFYEEKFGPYPWPRDGFKFVESPYEGMEHQTAIAYGNKYKNGYEGFDYIILHETAHEWWGNSVSAADLADAWLQEGFATYAEALFVESTQGRDAYLNYMYSMRLGIQNQRPVVRKRGIRYFSYKDEDVYSKGAWVLHSLRYVINNDYLFFSILKEFRMKNHTKQVLTEAFTSFVNERTKKNYDWFFKQYLYSREAPILEYFLYDQFLYYRWKNASADFALPVVFSVDGDPIKIIPTSKPQKVWMPRGRNYNFDNEFDVYYGYKINYDVVKAYKEP